MRVTGVDPEPEMLAAPMGAARDAQVEIELRRGSSFDMPAGIGPSRLVTMAARSTGWDRAATMDIPDRLIASEGAIAHFCDEQPRTAEAG